ncbi:hypothetical protein [Streptosporangium vulgare]|uniref:hypothetical protein n=1 Tax=Streptosporangium vulgare TaxID=46190 RepID=UPI0031DFA6D4
MTRRTSDISPARRHLVEHALIISVSDLGRGEVPQATHVVDQEGGCTAGSMGRAAGRGSRYGSRQSAK